MNSKRPLISVIIPTYNDAAYIKRAIESVLQQDFQDFEIIVVDDGSTDNTKEVLAPYLKNFRIRYIYQKNQGVSAARNRGILEANGEYITFLDADDCYLPYALRKRLDMLLRYNLSFGFTDYYLLKEVDDLERLGSLSSKLLELGFFSQCDVFRSDDLLLIYVVPRLNLCHLHLKYMNICIGTVIVKKHFLLEYEIMFDERLSISEDHDFIWKVLTVPDLHHVAVLGEATYIYQYYYASWFKHSKYNEKILYYKNIVSLLQRIFPRSLIAKRLYEDYWTIFRCSPLKFRFFLLNQILFLDPFNIKYWKSLLSLFFKSLLFFSCF